LLNLSIEIKAGCGAFCEMDNTMIVNFKENEYIFFLDNFFYTGRPDYFNNIELNRIKYESVLLSRTIGYNKSETQLFFSKNIGIIAIQSNNQLWQLK